METDWRAVLWNLTGYVVRELSNGGDWLVFIQWSLTGHVVRELSNGDFFFFFFFFNPIEFFGHVVCEMSNGGD